MTQPEWPMKFEEWFKWYVTSSLGTLDTFNKMTPEQYENTRDIFREVWVYSRYNMTMRDI